MFLRRCHLGDGRLVTWVRSVGRYLLAPVTLSLIGAICGGYLAQRLSGSWWRDVDHVRRALGYSAREIDAEQIVRKLREGDALVNEGKDIAEVLRHLEVSESSWNRWRAQYGGMKANEAKRLRELESDKWCASGRVCAVAK